LALLATVIVDGDKILAGEKSRLTRHMRLRYWLALLRQRPNWPSPDRHERELLMSWKSSGRARSRRP
jgi:hypothetical protein